MREFSPLLRLLRTLFFLLVAETAVFALRCLSIAGAMQSGVNARQFVPGALSYLAIFVRSGAALQPVDGLLVAPARCKSSAEKVLRDRRIREGLDHGFEERNASSGVSAFDGDAAHVVHGHWICGDDLEFLPVRIRCGIQPAGRTVLVA